MFLFKTFSQRTFLLYFKYFTSESVISCFIMINNNNNHNHTLHLGSFIKFRPSAAFSVTCPFPHLSLYHVVFSGDLTNRKWFSVVCTLIDNDIRHHSGQNVVDSRGAATIFNAKESFYFRAWPKSWLKERASVVYNFLAIWLVYFPKWAFLIGYYTAWQNDASMTRTALSRLSSTTAN